MDRHCHRDSLQAEPDDAKSQLFPCGSLHSRGLRCPVLLQDSRSNSSLRAILRLIKPPNPRPKRQNCGAVRITSLQYMNRDPRRQDSDRKVVNPAFGRAQLQNGRRLPQTDHPPCTKVVSLHVYFEPCTVHNSTDGCCGIGARDRDRGRCCVRQQHETIGI